MSKYHLELSAYFLLISVIHLTSASQLFVIGRMSGSGGVAMLTVVGDICSLASSATDKNEVVRYVL
jgi:hypothetical protein